jgi:hypothetical protein
MGKDGMISRDKHTQAMAAKPFRSGVFLPEFQAAGKSPDPHPEEGFSFPSICLPDRSIA